MGLHDSPHWIHSFSRAGVIPVTDIALVFDLAAPNWVWVLDACNEEEFLGLQYIYGKQINHHVIRDGRLIRFLPSPAAPAFIYPYDPTFYDVGYTEHAS